MFSVLKALFGTKEADKEVVEEEYVWVSNNKLRAIRQAFDDRMDGYDKRLDEYKKRLARCEQGYTAEIKELEDELEEVSSENEGLKTEVNELRNPSQSTQSELAQIFASWGYSAEQIIEIGKIAEDNSAILERMVEENGDMPVTTLVKSNRFVIENLLKQHVGEPAAKAKETTKTIGSEVKPF